MRTSGNVYGRIIAQSLLFFAIFPAIAQTGDTTYIRPLTDSVVIPPNSFFDFIKPDQQGVRPTVLYSGNDRFFVGVDFNRYSKDWNPDTAGQRHKLYARYSIEQNALSTGYQGVFNDVFRRWNLFVNASYDWIKWTNFYGLGNETIQETDDRQFYRVRSREALVSAALQNQFFKQSRFTITPFFQRLQLVNDSQHFLAKSFLSGNASQFYEPQDFGGINAALHLQQLNDVILPTKGVILSSGVTHVRSISSTRFFTNYSAYSRIFLPFLNHFVLSVEGGAATVVGEPEFYQMNSIGGSTLRGYRRDRFWGETMFHNNNELQYIFNINDKLFKGKMGFLAFVDQGRVWKKGEQSDVWHRGYGGGIMIVPFNRIYFSLQYGISNERRGIHVDFRRSL